VTDEQQTLTEDDLIDGRLVLIAAGKKNKVLVRLLR
jgi:tyrosyl-tRNA synthetase